MYYNKGKWYCNQWKYIDMGKEDRSIKGPSSGNECLNRKKEFNKIRVARHVCKDNSRATQSSTLLRQTCRYSGSKHPPKQCPVYVKMWMGCSKVGHFQKVCRSRRVRVVNKVEQETIEDVTDEDIKLVRINSVQVNKNCSILTANWKYLLVKIV